jgi:hypothetical protein
MTASTIDQRTPDAVIGQLLVELGGSLTVERR